MRDLRILVAEDNEDHMFLTTRVLRRMADVKVEVVGVRDGVEAVDYLYGRGDFEGRMLPDFVLLDLSLPRRNGLDVLKIVKGDRGLLHIPVVVLTSSDRPEDIRAAYSMGANSYVTKARGVEGVFDYWARTAALPDAGVPEAS
jgi:CheY-like chemotaxis protein